MALLIAEGFDIYGYSSVNWLNDSRWLRYVPNGDVDLLTTSGRRSGPGLRVGDNASSTNYGYAKCDWGSAITTLYAGFALNLAVSANGPATYLAPVQFRNVSNTAQVSVNRTATYAVQVRTGGVSGSVIATSADGVLSPGAYQYIEIGLVCHATTGSVVVKVDGIEVINQANVNTQGAGSGGYNSVTLATWFATSLNSPVRTYYDDFYVCDDSGGAPFNAFLGDQKMEGHLFTADGSLADWASTKVSHYDAIDERGSTYATNYNESDAVGECDSYTITPAALTTVKAITIRAYCVNLGGGTAKFKPFVLIGGTKYYGTEQTLPAGTTDLLECTWEQNPATASAWTPSALGSASCQFGWETTELS